VGFLGRNIVRLLLERKDAAHDLHVLDINLPAEDERNDLVASYIQGDVRDVGHVQEALTGIDTVFHTAGVFSHNVNVTDEMMWDVNVKGTENIVKTCQDKSIRKLIFTSTCIVTMGKDDATAEGWDEERPYPREPVNGYVSSKIAAETIVLAANTVTPDGKGLATCVLRPAGMFGIGDKMMADMALTGRDNYYIGDGTARFDLVHVDSVALGHICAAEHLEPVNNQV
jgi:nucleoside-diphosphate-sugar epimerase